MYLIQCFSSGGHGIKYHPQKFPIASSIVHGFVADSCEQEDDACMTSNGSIL